MAGERQTVGFRRRQMAEKLLGLPAGGYTEPDIRRAFADRTRGMTAQEWFEYARLVDAYKYLMAGRIAARYRWPVRVWRAVFSLSAMLALISGVFAYGAALQWGISSPYVVAAVFIGLAVTARIQLFRIGRKIASLTAG